MCNRALNLINQNRQFAPLPLQFRDIRADTTRPHPLVKALGVRVGLDLQRLKSQCSRPLKSMSEQRAAHSTAHCLGQHPQMLQPQLAAVGTATNAIPAFANVDPPRMLQLLLRFIF